MRMKTIESFLVTINLLFSYPSKFLEIPCRLDVLVDEFDESFRSSEGELDGTDQNDNGQYIPVECKNRVQNEHSPWEDETLIAKKSSNGYFSLVFSEVWRLICGVLQVGHFFINQKN